MFRLFALASHEFEHEMFLNRQFCSFGPNCSGYLKQIAYNQGLRPELLHRDKAWGVSRYETLCGAKFVAE
jgi:hypothetical protein